MSISSMICKYYRFPWINFTPACLRIKVTRRARTNTRAVMFIHMCACNFVQVFLFFFFASLVSFFFFYFGLPFIWIEFAGNAFFSLYCVTKPEETVENIYFWLTGKSWNGCLVKKYYSQIQRHGMHFVLDRNVNFHYHTLFIWFAAVCLCVVCCLCICRSCKFYVFMCIKTWAPEERSWNLICFILHVFIML